MKLILLVIARDGEYDRRILRGIGSMMAAHDDWRLRLLAVGTNAVEATRIWKPDGVIGRVSVPGLAAELRRLRIPAVNTSNAVAVRGVPRVGVDERAIGQMAAEYFLARGFTNFGYFTLDASYRFIDERWAGYAETLRRRGLRPWRVRYAPRNWAQYDAHIVEWARGLAAPAAVLAPIDTMANTFCEICRQAGRQVPEEMAVMGVDNDDLLCEISHPPLSSINIPGERIGQESVLMLDSLMKGRPAPRSPLLVPPAGIVIRRSTDIQAIEHPAVAQAVRFIHEHADRPISVSDVLEDVPMARRALEQHFRRLLGRTPLAEINRVHVEKARDLLTRTPLSLPAVARASGLVNRQRLSVLFKKITGQTPARYRQQLRAH